PRVVSRTEHSASAAPHSSGSPPPAPTQSPSRSRRQFLPLSRGNGGERSSAVGSSPRTYQRRERPVEAVGGEIHTADPLNGRARPVLRTSRHPGPDAGPALCDGGASMITAVTEPLPFRGKSRTASA